MTSLSFCMITTFYPPYHFGGDAIGIQRLCHALARRGHRVTVIHDVDAWRAVSGASDPPTVPEPAGVTVHRLESGLRMLSPLLTQQIGRPVVHGRTIRRLLEEGDFDVVNFHNVSLVGGPGLLEYGSGVKLYMAHEHWLVCPSHVLWRYNRELCDGRDCFRCAIAFHRPPQYWRYSHLLESQLHHVDAFIAMSRFSRDKHREFGFSREMDVLPYFLPDEGDAEPGGDDGPPHTRPYFFFVGRLEAIKGLDDVIPIFRRYPNADLLIAGEGTYGAHLRALAGDAPNVRFLGRLGLDDLERYYRHALALVVPSVCYETFGIIIIESFRHGTPVLARRIGPFPEIIEQSGGGEMFESPDELLAAMQRLQNDEPRRRRLGLAGAAALKTYWSESVVLGGYFDIIRRVALRKGMSRVADALTTLDPSGTHGETTAS
ncbi:MAG: glycosyltransferase family 4 protein [Vicinamibacterales bacterium]